MKSLEDRIKELENRISELENQKRKGTGWKCNHQTIPWGVHKRKCGICGEIFIVD